MHGKGLGLSRSGSRCALAAAVMGLPFALSANGAVDYVWQANNGSGNLSGSWNTAANWSPTGPADGVDNIADFSQQDIAAFSTVTLDANQTIGNLIFGDTTTTSASSWVIAPGSGNFTLTLAVSSGSPTITVNSLGTGGNAEITAALAGTQGFTKAGTAGLILGSGASDSVAELYTGATFVTAGTLLLNKAAGTDAITGNVVINGSTAILALNQADQIDDSSTLTLSSGAFQGNAHNETIASLVITGGNFQTIGGTGTSSNTITINNLLTLSGGTLTLNSTNTGGTTINTRGMLMTGGSTVFGTSAGGIQRLIIGSGGLTISNATTLAIGAGTSGIGGGDLVLNGNLSTTAILNGSTGASITGPASTTGVVGGVIDLNGQTPNFYIENGTPTTDLDISAIIGSNGAYKSVTIGSNTGNLTKTGSGTLQLDPFFQDNFGGTVAVNEGTLTLAFTHLASGTDLIINGSSPNSSPLTLGGGTLSIVGNPTASVATSQTFGGTFTLNPGGSGIALNANGGAGVTLTLPNTWSRSTGATLFANLSAAGNATVVSNPATDPTGILPYATVKDATGTGFATVNGGNIGRYTGATVLTASSNAGLTSDTNYFVNLPSGTTTTTLGGSANSLQATAAATSTVSFGGSTFTLASGGFLITGGASLQITLSNGTLASSTNELIIHQGESSGGILFLSASLAVPTPSSLTIDGTSGGTVALQNASLTFTGGVQLNAGEIVAVTASSKSTGGVLTSGPLGIGTLTFDGGGFRSTTGANTEIDNAVNLEADLTIPTAGTDKVLTLGGPITLVGGNHTIFQNSTAALVLSGVISDGGQGYALNKAGSGILTITAPNAFGGGMRIDAGRLLINNASGSGTGAGPVTDRAGTLAGTGTIAGATTVNSGATISAGDGASITGLLTLSSASGNVLSDGSKYSWKINDAAGAAGTSDGWDQIAFSSLTVGTATGVDVAPLAVGTGGTVSNFQTGQAYQFPIATVPGNGTALAANFHLDTTALNTFATAVGAPASSFSISADPTDIYVSYTPAPEPGSLALLGLAAGGVTLRRRRTVAR